MQALVNAYYLQEEAARGHLGLVDETLAAAKRMGATLVRAWAFNDDPNKRDTGIQRGRLLYRERGLAGIDRLLARARAHGVRLILPLVNHWNAYGGARQWLRWNGVSDGTEGDARFFTLPRVRDHYARHVERLLTRTNELTGVRWGDDETVLAWELMNEPRGRGLDGDGAQLADWVAFAAAAMRAHTRRPIALGDEGEQISFDGHDERFWRAAGGAHLFARDNGGSFTRMLAHVDFATCHFYPEKYGLVAGSEAEAGCAWIEEHAAIARAAGKRLLVEELGARRRDRAQLYAGWMRAARAAGCAAAGPWLFAYRSRPAAWDEFTFRAGSPVARVVRQFGHPRSKNILSTSAEN